MGLERLRDRIEAHPRRALIVGALLFVLGAWAWDAREAIAQTAGVYGRGILRVLVNGVRQPSGVSEIDFRTGLNAYRDGGILVVESTGSGSGGGHVIQDETVDLEQAPIMRFTGSGVTVTTVDAGATVDSGSATVVAIPGGYQTVGVVDAGSYSQRGAVYVVPGGGVTVAGSDNSGENTTYLAISQLGVTTSFECTLQTTNGTGTACGNISMATSGANYFVIGRCVGIQSDNSNAAGYMFSMSARNSAGTVTANGGVTAIVTHESNAAWTATFGAPSGTNVPVNVTGAAGVTVNWRCYAEITQQ